MRMPRLTRPIYLVATVPLALWALFATRAPAPQRAFTSGTLEPTTSMSAARAAHTATTLRDGRVLIVGGFTGEASVAQGAEIFDPATDRYSQLPRVLTLRHSHTATLLPNGKVLIAGGYADGSVTVAKAELFDPARNTFTATGSMLAPRAGHIAVQLGNGTVLIAGGVGPDWSFLASAELYDPATGVFSRTGDMTVARESHIAERLPDGRVLIAGGHRGRRAEMTVHASAETYDAASGTFTATGGRRVARHKHDAVLLRDGRVLITGGADKRDADGVYNTTELFNPAYSSFTMGPTMKQPRYKHNGSSLLLPNGDVLIAGGAPQAEVYHTRNHVFASVGGSARMAGQFSAAALLRDSRVLVTGGYGNGTGPRASAWVYRP